MSDDFDEKWEAAIKRTVEKYKDFPFYKRTWDQTCTLVDAVEFFLRDFPEMRLGQIMNWIVPEGYGGYGGPNLGNIYDEEVIRRLDLFRAWQAELSANSDLAATLDWVTYLRLHPNAN